MTGLDDVFTRTLPSLIKKKSDDDVVVGFVATGAPETGAWVVRLRDGVGRRTAETDRPDVIVEAQASVIALLFAGAIDVDKAIQGGQIIVRGDRSALMKVVQAL
jgi:hypothetical protein